MSDIKILGIDIAKEVFQLCGINQHGKVVYTKRVSRLSFLKTIVNLQADLVVMEACGGANHWSREMRSQGINVKLISPQFVKPFVKTNKNDRNDAFAIAEAASRAEMRFVPGKTVEQQDIQSLLTIRQRLIKHRTGLVNEMRGLLLEYGIAIPKSIAKVYQHVPQIIEDKEQKLTPLMRHAINRLYCELLNMREEVSYYEAELKNIYRESELCRRLETIPGVGFLTALTTMVTMGNASHFKNARQFAAFVGLVPKQRSSGNRELLLGISKRGNVLLRTLLIHGARSVIYHLRKKVDKTSVWLRSLIERRGVAKAAVALANKNARVIWALLKHESTYKMTAVLQESLS
jgi:transposase